MESVYKYRRTGRYTGGFRGISASGGMLNRYAFGGARAGAYTYRSRYPRYGMRSRYGRRTGAGYTRRVGLYGRFGTGRSNNAQIEKKFYDTPLSLPASTGVTSTTQATGQIAVGIAQGTSASTRIGQKIIIKSIQVKLNATLAAGATDTDIVHVYLVQDTQTNGVQATYADVFDTSGDIGSEMRNMANSNRFKILKHFTFRLNADAGVAAAFGGDYQQDECFIKCNIPIMYNSNAGAITEIKTNSLFLLHGSNAGVATVTGNARLRYTDR